MRYGYFEPFAYAPSRKRACTGTRSVFDFSDRLVAKLRLKPSMNAGAVWRIFATSCAAAMAAAPKTAPKAGINKLASNLQISAFGDV